MSRYTSPANVSPEVLAGVEDEQSYAKRRSNDISRIKFKKGESVKVRFLPAQLGPSKRWYARIAKHWSGMKPITCLKHTHPDYGGEADYPCPVCELADSLNDNHSKVVSTAGYKLMATAQWMTYCLLFAKSDGGPFRPVPEDEVSTVYVYDHYKSTYEELVNFVRNGVSSSRPMSVLDYVAGNDFIASKTGNGTRLDKQDPEPVFDPQSPEFEAFIQSLEAQMVTPKIIIPTDEELREFADKAHELALKSAHSAGSDGGRGRYGGYNEGDDRHESDSRHEREEPAPEEPAAAPRRGAPVRPAPTATRGPAPAARGTAAPAAAAPAARTAAPARTAPAPATRSAAPAPTRSAAPAPTRSAAPAPTRSAAPAASASSVDAEEENVPEEGTDQAPPIDESLETAVDAGEAGGEGVDAGEAEPPTPVATPGRPGLGQSLRDKIAAARRQERR